MSVMDERPLPDERRRRRSGSATGPSIDRLPPHDIQAEQGVLSSMLFDRFALIEAADTVQKDDFYDMRHSEIFGHMTAMLSENVPVDIITLQSRLRTDKALEAVGGLAYLIGLQDLVPTGANLPHYVEIIRDKARLRSVIQACVGVVSQVYENESVDQAEMAASRAMMQISDPRDGKGFRTAKSLVHEALTSLEQDHASQGRISGIPTGFQDLDKLISGLNPEEMIVIGARPAVGKSSLAMNIVEHAAVEAGAVVGLFSFEMTGKSIIKRMICSRARLNHRNIRDGIMAERDFPRLTSAAGKISNAQIHICDDSGMTISQLRSKARRMFHQHGVKLFVLDYLQLMAEEGRGFGKRNDEVARMSNGLARLSTELKVPIIVLSQLNRDVDKGKGARRPRLSDLRESGAVEQDASVVALLYREDEDRDDRDEQPRHTESSQTILEVAKNRNGPTGTVRLMFNKSITRFESASKISEEDIPQPSLPY